MLRPLNHKVHDMSNLRLRTSALVAGASYFLMTAFPAILPPARSP